MMTRIYMKLWSPRTLDKVFERERSLRLQSTTNVFSGAKAPKQAISQSSRRDCCLIAIRMKEPRYGALPDENFY
jgi:hypothetical protein